MIHPVTIPTTVYFCFVIVCSNNIVTAVFKTKKKKKLKNKNSVYLIVTSEKCWFSVLIFTANEVLNGSRVESVFMLHFCHY